MTSRPFSRLSKFWATWAFLCYVWTSTGRKPGLRQSLTTSWLTVWSGSTPSPRRMSIGRHRICWMTVDEVLSTKHKSNRAADSISWHFLHLQYSWRCPLVWCCGDLNHIPLSLSRNTWCSDQGNISCPLLRKRWMLRRNTWRAVVPFYINQHETRRHREDCPPLVLPYIPVSILIPRPHRQWYVAGFHRHSPLSGFLIIIHLWNTRCLSRRRLPENNPVAYRVGQDNTMFLFNVFINIMYCL